MNRKQRTLLWIGVGLIVFLILFPPYRLHDHDNPAFIVFGGYKFIFSLSTSLLGDERIDYGRLALPITVVALIAITAIYTSKDKKRRE